MAQDLTSKFSKIFAALALPLLLAACSGGSSSSSGDGSPPSADAPPPSTDAPPPNADAPPPSTDSALSAPHTPPSIVFSPQPRQSWAGAQVTFDPARAASFAVSSEFLASDASCATVGCGVSPSGTQSKPFELHNLHWAHSAGLTGAGKVVAIVDDGFRLTHREFAGKTISQTGTLPVAGHGTLVASLVAGSKDGLGMHGVAPGADLHLTSFQPSGTGSSLPNITTGTLAAASLGAVVQNNSWGFDLEAERLQTYLSSNPGASVAQGMNAIAGHGTANWQSYIEALDSFQNSGVVVWALSNTNEYTSGDIMGALPAFEHRLAEAWITAANGYFEVDGNGAITRAVRLSAACGMAAHFCIAGDGITRGAWHTGDTDYRSGLGTSFVAPQVSGAVALLAEAFPDMTPSEWAQRLLASADNSWFASQSVPIAGIVDYGNGVSHAFSTEWGHGVMDIKAALSPIGTVSVLSGTSVTTAERHGLAESRMVSPPSFGDGLQAALAPQQMAVFDALNRAYSVSPVSAVSAAPVAFMPRLPGQARLEQARNGLALMHTDDLGGALGRLSGPGGDGSVLSMAGETVIVASSAPVGSVAELTAYGFAAEHRAVENGSLTGAGMSLSLPLASGSVYVGARLANERGGVMGLRGGSAFDVGSGSTVGAVNMGFEQELGNGLGFFGGLELGAASRHGGADGLISDLSNLTFSGMEFGASLSNALFAGDRLTLLLSQPLRIETGTLELTRPVGRAADGSILIETSTADLKSSGRQLDLGLNYQAPLGDAASVGVALKHSVNAGHVAGQSGSGVLLGFQQRF